MHAIASAVVTTGSMGWLVNPLSYFGLAPFSYSPAVPASMAAFSQLSGLDMEPSILAYSIPLALITPWVAFLLGRTVFHRNETALFLAFLVTSADGMIGFTDWTLSTRGTFLVFTPLAAALFLKSGVTPTPSRTHTQALVLVLSVLVFVHALWLILVPSLVAVWLTYRLATTEDFVLRQSLSASARSKAVLVTSAAICSVLVAVLLVGPVQTGILEGLPQLRGGPIPNNVVTDAALQLATVMGLGVLLLPFGIYKVIRVPETRRRHALVALAIVFLPISLDPVYGVLVAIPVVLLISTFAFASIDLPSKRPSARTTRLAAAAALLIAVLAVGAPALITLPRTSGLPCGEPWTLDGQTYNAALYVKYTQPANTTFAWDDGVEASRIEAISGVPGIEPLQSIGSLEYPWLARKMTVHLTLASDPIQSLARDQQLLSADEWLPVAGLRYEYYWGKHETILLRNALGSPSATQIIDFYQATLAIQRCPTEKSAFFTGLNSSNYVVYTDELQRDFLL